LSRDEKILVLLYRIQFEQAKTLMGSYKSYEIGQKKIRKMKNKIKKLGGNPDIKLNVDLL
jgi:hypothetical protein